MVRAILGIVVVMLGMSCTNGEETARCPATILLGEDGWTMDPYLEDKVHSQVKSMVTNPESYEETDVMTASWTHSNIRENGSKYYNRVYVHFQAKDDFAMVSATATVHLEEDEYMVCRITDIEIEQP